MSARSIRRAQERQAKKLARKVDKAAGQAAGHIGPDASLCPNPSRDSETGASATYNRAAFLNQPVNPELYDEFSPEFIAEARAIEERVLRNAGILPRSNPRPSEPRPSPNGRLSPTPLDTESRPQEAVSPSEPLASTSERVSPAQLDSEPRASASGHLSPAQLSANRANSQLSTGAKSTEGKRTVSFNAFRHGLAGRFVLLPHENEHEFKELFHGLQHEHHPTTPTEHLLVERMAQHWWLAQRALYLQGFCFNEAGACDHDQHLALYLRYQTTHERAFHKSLNDLLKLRAEKRKEQIGFVSQERKRKEEAHKEADQIRRAAREKRQHERHQWAALLDRAKLDHQNLMNLQLPGGVEFVKQATQRIIALESAA